MALYKEQGIVLRTMRLGEADRILTLVTQGSGKVRAVAKGIRKTKSRFGGRLEPFTHVDLLLYRGRELDIVTQAEVISAFRPIRESYARFAAAEVVAEAADRVVQERERSVRTFVLVLNSLRALAEGAGEPGLVADSFLLRLASLAGFRPVLDACAECGRAGAHPFFSIAQGGAVCASCRAGGAARIGESTLPYLGGLLDDGWAAVGPDDARREGSGLVRAYLEYHLDRPLRAWSHVPR